MKMRIMLDKGAYIPKFAHGSDAGADLFAPRQTLVPANGSAVIDTGVHFEIPVGWFGKIESKSGLNVKHGIVSLGGVIDAQYIGSVRVKVYNMTSTPYVFEEGDKVAQIIFQPCANGCEFEVSDRLDETERGENGFGSTGR